MKIDAPDLSIDELKQLKRVKRAGKFKISADKEIYGELTFAGRNTTLIISDDNFLCLEQYNKCIQGTLNDLTKLTLLNCVSGGERDGLGENGGSHYANIFPDFIIGRCHINPDENIVTAIEFVIDDASTLFPDYTTFGRVIDASPYIEEIVRANDSQIGLKFNIPIGSHPQILYFTGKHEIFTANTLFGEVSASHCPTCGDSGDSNGVQIKNTIFVSVVFAEAINFEECIARTLTLLEYLGVLVGRSQNLLRHRISLEPKGECPVFLDVYWSRPPKRRSVENGQLPHYTDILLNAVHEPRVFSQVLKNWLMRDQCWQDARQRFFNSFSQQESYPIDRLIGAANMFDILPSCAVPPKVELTDKLESAKADCRKIFKQLPKSIERESVLLALGHVGKSSLKHKIRHRAKFLLDVAGDNFPDLFTVTDEAVKCRNHYVHGNSKTSFDYNKEFDIVIFFTNTLEFIFAMSDLIEAEWDFKAWIHRSSCWSHPFRYYRTRYDENLQYLQSLLKQS
jgi:ApeA N-terminal domain 1